MLKRKRNSNIELLRIIGMFFIIQSHFIIRASEQASYLSQNLYNLQILGGAFGVNVFILITCFFMVGKDFSLKRIKKIVTQTLFYAVLFMVPWLFIIPDIDKALRWLVMTPINYWFVTAYIIFLMTIPIVNWIISRLNNRQIKVLMWSLLFLISIIPTVLGIDLGPLRVTIFYFFYLFAYYLKNIKDDYISKKLIYTSLVLLVLIYFAIVSWSSFFELDFLLLTYIPQKHLQNNVFQVLISCLVLMIFIEITPRYNEAINKLSGSIFAAYLIQEHGLILELKQKYLSDIFIDNLLLLTITNFLLTLALLIIFCGTDQILKNIISTIKSYNENDIENIEMDEVGKSMHNDS